MVWNADRASAYFTVNETEFLGLHDKRFRKQLRSHQNHYK